MDANDVINIIVHYNVFLGQNMMYDISCALEKSTAIFDSHGNAYVLIRSIFPFEP